MSVIIRLQNLPWSANALDIRNFFRGLSIPEGGVHIVGGELGDAFIAFSTDEDARQGMMLDGGKIKEIQVKLLLSSRSEMHKVIETARQSVPILSLAPAPPPVSVPAPAPLVSTPTPTPIIPTVTPFSAALGNSMSSYGIPGIGNPQEIPQPAVIEPPAPLISPTIITPEDESKDEGKRIREKDRRRSRSRSRSRDRDRKDRKRDRRDRSRSRDRRRRDRSRSRDRRDRKRDRNRSRSHDRSPSRRSRDKRDSSRRTSPRLSQEKMSEQGIDSPVPGVANNIGMLPKPMLNQNVPPHLQQQMLLMNSILPNAMPAEPSPPNRMMLPDPATADTFSKIQELGKKRNPNAFQGQQQDQQQQNNGGRFQGGRGGPGRGGQGIGRGGQSFRRGERPSRFESDCCVAIRNAPNHTSYGDVRRFFPFMIDKHGIKMINDNMGRRTGNIFVRFCDPRSKQLALQRKVNELKGASVLVETLEDDAYETAVDSFLPFREDNDEDDSALVIPDDESLPPFSVLKLTDLPNFVKEHDIIKIFSDFSLLSIMLNDCRMTRSKVAYVQFVKCEDAKIAFDRKESYMFGRRHPTITPVTNEEYDKEKIVQNEKMAEPQLGPPPAKVEPAPEVQAPRDPRQRRQFDNGAAKNGAPTSAPQTPFFSGPFVPQTPMQQNFVPPYVPTPFSGFPGSGAVDPRTAAANWATRPGGPLNQPNQINQMPMATQNQPIDLEEDALDCVLMKGLPRDATDRTIVTFLSDTNAVPARIHLMLDTNGQPSGDCFCEFRSTQEARMAATKHGQSLDGCNVSVDLVTRSVVEEALEGPKQMENMRDGLLGTGPNVVAPFFDGQVSNGPGGPRGFAPRGGYRGRGGFDGNRGGFEGNRGGFEGNRGGFDGNRGGFDNNRSGFDNNRGGFDSNRGGFDRYNNRGGFDQGRGSYRGRGGFDRGRGFERGRGRGFGATRGRGGGGGVYENGGRDQMRNEDEQDPALEDFGAPGCVVSMENVPFRASIDDIMTFFSEFELTQDDVIRRYNERGQPTGDARVAFRTPFDAQRAVKTRHMDTIHDRRINLTIL